MIATHVAAYSDRKLLVAVFSDAHDPHGHYLTVWTGIGGVGAFIVGITVLSEPITMLRLLAATLIISGLILMKVAGS
jgi:multidrug transporter EmrE-like cation transporter